MRRFSLLALTAVATVALATTGAAQGSKATGKGLTKAPTGTHGPKSGGSVSGAGKTTKSTGSSNAGSNSNAGSKKTSSTSTTSTTTTTTTTTGTGTTTTTNALATKISGNPDQLARITAMLPAGVSLEDATKGFRNQGQFIAALNASKNRPNVDFLALQEAMTVDGLSLGQAVKKVQSAPAPTTTTTGDSTTGTGTTTTGTTTTGDSSTGTTTSQQ